MKITNSMTGFICLAVAAWVMGNGICLAAEDNRGDIAVFYSCDLGAKLAAAVVRHTETSTGAPIRLAPCIESEKPGLAAFAEAVRGAIAPDDRIAVALYLMDRNETDRAIFTVDNGDQPFAMVNVRTLLRDDSRRSPSDKLIVRRTQKEALRAIAALAGLQECPTIFCSSQRHANIEKLDAKSYNYCPPCRLKVEALLRKRGMIVKTQIEQIRERLKNQPDS